MAIELFPKINDNITDKVIDQTVDNKDIKDTLKTGKMPDDISFTLQDSSLNEYSGESNFEPYTGIVLDPTDNEFKTSSGMFRDKKDFYEKLTKRGYVVRKVFEKKVFDWIEKNAKTTLEAYLMFSTAFSKWKGNNLLNPYYTKLLNDIPQLNREKVKGNPNTRVMGTEEAVIDEDYQKPNVPGAENWSTHDVTLIPIKATPNEDGTEDYSEYESNAPWLQQRQYPRCKVPNELGYTVNQYITSILTKSGNSLIHEIFEDINNKDLEIDAEGKVIDKNPIVDDHFFVNLNNVNDSPKYFLVYIDGKGFINKVDGSKVSFDETENSPFILRRTAIIGMNKNETELGREIKGPSAQSVLSAKLNNKNSQNIRNVMLNGGDLSDLENDEEIKSLKSAITTIIKSNPKSILFTDDDRVWKDFMSNEKHNELKTEYEKLATQKDYLSGNNSDVKLSNFAKKVLDVYQGDDKLKKINEISKRQNDILDEINNSVTLRIDEEINEIKEKLNLIATGKVLGKADDLYERKVALENRLKYIVSKLTGNKQSFNPSSYKGNRAKYTTTQDQLGINQGIHGKKESNENIPVVDDIRPFKRVNYGATASYANLPVDGVITNPGAIPSSGQFMYEQDEHWGWQHEELNPLLFDGNVLRPEIREALLNIAKKFKETLGLNIEPVDIYFTGSSANFNYNDQSDIDLHLVYDFEEIGINSKILIKYFVAKKKLFNNDYDITVKSIPVEVGVENLNEPIVSSAIYSVLNNKWMLEPKYVEKLLPQPDMEVYNQITQSIENAIESQDSEQIGKLWKKLYDIRKQSLASEGEFSKGNGLFKKLRNLGYLDRLKNAYYSTASEELSLC